MRPSRLRANEEEGGEHDQENPPGRHDGFGGAEDFFEEIGGFTAAEEPFPGNILQADFNVIACDSDRDLFPLPVSAPVSQGSSRSGRCRARVNRRLTVEHKLAGVIRGLNTLYQRGPGIPRPAAQALTGLGATPPNEVQAGCLRDLRSRVATAVCRDFYRADAGAEQGPTRSGEEKKALWLDAGLVDLPADMRQVEMMEYLPNEDQARYAEPSAEVLLLLGSALGAAPSRRSRNLVKKGHYTAIIQQLLDRGMVKLQREKPKVINSLFAVEKDVNRQRLIFNGVPANACFIKPPKTRLPSPDDIAGLRVDKDAPLFCGKSDINSMYHRLRTPSWLWQYFGLPAVRGEDFNFLPGVLWPVYVTLPMGWSHSVYIATQVHKHIVEAVVKELSRDILTGDRLIRGLRHGIYIDDFFILGLNKAEVNRVLRLVIERLNEVGLVIRSTKVAFADDAEECVVLGLAVTRQGQVFPTADRVRAVLRETRLLLRRGKATPKAMQVLLGRWTWILLLRRPLLSVFRAVYLFAAKSSHLSLALGSFVRAELELVMELLPLCVASLTWPDAGITLATDASKLGGAAVFAPASIRVGKHGITELRSTDLRSMAPEVSFFVASQPWTTVVKAKWRFGNDICCLEYAATLLGLRWATRQAKLHHTDLAVLVDNQALCFGLRKGRSSTISILLLLRRLAALQLAANLHLTALFVPTESNPADEPSRRF